MNPPTHNQPPEKPPGFQDKTPPFSSKAEALANGYVVEPMCNGTFMVYHRGTRQNLRGKSELSTWSLILGAK